MSIISENIKDLEIDKFNLDNECITQPELYASYSDMAISSAEERDLARLEMETLEATLDEKIRLEYRDRGEKVTEKVVETSILRNTDYIEAQLKYIKKKTEAAKLDAMRQAFEQRKSMLEMVCRLFLGEYYSDISVKDKGKVSEKIALETIKEGLRRKV